ncbi:MAG: alpha/beta fold hydrolase [Pseudonocardiaceae bacterium]
MATASVNGITVGYDDEGAGEPLVLIHGQDVAGHVLTMMLQTPAEGAAAALRARAERPDYTELLARTSGPVLVVVGRDDEFTPVAVAEFMATLIPQARLAVIDGAAHLPNLEQKAEFNHVLRHFLTDSAE